MEKYAKSICIFFFFFGCQSQKLCMPSFDLHVKTETASLTCTIVSRNWESIFPKGNEFQTS